MATRLIQIVAFATVPPSGVAALPHDINVGGVPERPDFVAGDATGFDIVVNATTVTVTNNNAVSASINVWLERQHTIIRQLNGGVQNLVPQPFVVATGGGSSGSAIDVEDEGVPIGTFTTLNFIGAGVTATDGGSGVADVTIPGGSGVASASNVLTFRPGSGLTGPTVFDDFDDLYTQLVALRAATSNSGIFHAVFDDTLAPCNIPAGATYDMNRTVWIGIRWQLGNGSTVGQVPVTFLAGTATTINNLTEIIGLVIINNQSGNAPIKLGTGSVQQNLNLRGTTIVASTAGTIEVLFESAIRLYEEGILDGDDDPLASSVSLAANTPVDIYMIGEGSVVDPDAFIGGATTDIELINMSASARFNTTQTNFAGSALFTQRAASGYFQNGNPNGVLQGFIGSLAIDTSSGTVYRNTDNGSTWAPPSTIAAANVASDGSQLSGFGVAATSRISQGVYHVTPSTPPADVAIIPTVTPKQQSFVDATVSAGVITVTIHNASGVLLDSAFFIHVISGV